MIGTFSFIFGRTVRNMAVYRLKRMREPRYLIATLGGAAYVYFTWFQRWGRHSHGSAAQALEPMLRQPRIAGGIELAACLILGIVVLGAWVLPQSAAALRFTEAEVQFLFTGPVSRTALIQYKLLRSQVALLFGTIIISVVFSGRVMDPSTWCFSLGMWLILLTLNMHFLGIDLLRTTLIEHGWSAARRRWMALGVFAAGVAIAVWSARSEWPALKTAMQLGVGDLLEEATRSSHLGAAGWLFAPLRAMVRPLLSPTLAEFWPRALPAVAILTLNYVWVLRSQVAFEEASAESSEKAARKLDGLRRGGVRTRMPAPAKRKPPFVLSVSGRPETAVFWKNLIAAGRSYNVRVLLGLLALIGVSAGLGPTLLPHLPGFWGVMAGVIAVFVGAMFVFGGTLFRTDFRQDLVDLELLRTWPLRGWQLTLAEVAVPVAQLFALELLGILALMLIVPRAGMRIADTPTVECFLVGVLLLAPAISLGSVLIQNLVVLLFPAWVSLGQERSRGLEASGQRMLTLVMTLLGLSVALIPAGLGALLAYFMTFRFIGPGAFVVTGFSASVILLAEGAAGVVLLGKLFEDLDAAKAGILKT